VLCDKEDGVVEAGMPALEHVSASRGLDEPRLVHVTVLDFLGCAAGPYIIVLKNRI
jgi:hypothetical protein